MGDIVELFLNNVLCMDQQVIVECLYKLVDQIGVGEVGGDVVCVCVVI